MTPVHVDFETRSAVDLKKTGVHVYAADDSTDVHCLAYAFGDEPVELWHPGLPPPTRLLAHVRAGGQLIAHNAAFERAIWHHVMTPNYGWPEPEVTQWRCTMSMAYAMALPGALEHVAAALNTGFSKDMAGHRLMMAMAKPRRVTKKDWITVEEPCPACRHDSDGEYCGACDGERVVASTQPPEGHLWREDQADLERLYAYCKSDVEAERASDKRLVRLRPAEQALWHLDQVINDRGVPIDENFVRRSVAVVDAYSETLDKRMSHVTDFEVTACSNVGQLKTWLKQNGVEPGQKLNKKTMLYADTLDKEFLATLLRDPRLPPKVRSALDLRQQGSLASVSKLDAALRGMSADGRARGTAQFHAASTGRWAGRRVQFQNIKRPDEDFDVDGAIDVIERHPPARAIDILDTLYGPPLTCISYTLRGMVRAPKGKKIVAADFTSIEGVVLPWLAGEQFKLDAFRQYLAGKGPDMYLVAASGIYGIPVGHMSKKTHPEERQIGKVAELACGYGGGVGAFQQMGAALGVHVADDKAEQIKSAWRAAHPNIVQFWWDLEAAAIEAVQSPGRKVECGPVLFKQVGSFLWLQLPSGRALCYPYPRVMELPTPWGQLKEMLTFKTVPNVSNAKKIVHSDKTNTSKWARISTYGGMLSENVTQAVARDLLAEALVRLEAHGYPIILHVHDEAVAEVDEGFGSASEFEQIMSELPPWASGLPVAASGFEAERYRK